MTDVTCAACGSAQSAGSAFCAVCGQPFPRTGRPVAEAAPGPAAGVRSAAGAGRPEASLPPYAAPRTSTPDTTTEPEVHTATQKAAFPVPTATVRGLAAAPSAGVGRRVLAYVVDAAVPGVLALAVVLVGFELTDVPVLGGVREVTSEEASALLGRLAVVYAVAVLVALAWWVATWAWEGSTGKTLGNLAAGIRTLDATTRAPIGFGRALVRWLVVGAGAVVLVVGQWVVVLSPAFDSSGRRQGWQDKAARAVVVDARGVTTPPAAPERSHHAGAPPGTPGGPGTVAGPGAWQVAPPGASQPAAPAPAPVPDPWAFPSSTGSSVESSGRAAGDGLITGVPGMSPPPGAGAPAPAATPAPTGTRAPTAAPAPEPAPAPTPAPHVPAQAPPVPEPAPVPASAPAVVREPDEPDWDSTRMSARDLGAMEPVPVVTVVLELESGERRVVDGPTLVGRNPQSAEGGSWNLVAVDDPTRSVSKTHVELGVDPGGLWLTDRGSTNGTVVSVPGAPPRVAEPGARVRVPVGATIHVGDRRLAVHAGSA